MLPRFSFTFTFLGFDRSSEIEIMGLSMQVGELKGEKGRATGLRAINDVIDHGLFATPENYELWLHYQNNWTPALTNDMESYIKSGQPLDETTIEKLYERHLSSTRLDSAVMLTGARLAKELADALDMLKSAGHRTEAFSENLDNAAQALDTGRLDSHQLMSLIKSLSSATRAMSEENAELTQRLEVSSREVDDLRGHLQKVRLESLTDILTGLANRRMFEDTLRMRAKEATSLDYPLSLALCDIDFFKKFNDTWGHQTGDQVIRFVASVLKSYSLNDQLVARYGGEEFAIVIPRLTTAEARDLMEDIRHAVERKQLKRKSTDETLGRVTISIGIATLTKTESCASLIHRADEMLYVSKRTGRNRTTIWPQEQSAVA